MLKTSSTMRATLRNGNGSGVDSVSAFDLARTHALYILCTTWRDWCTPDVKRTHEVGHPYHIHISLTMHLRREAWHAVVSTDGTFVKA